MANSVAIRFFPMKPGHFFLIQSWARAAVWAGAPSCWKMKLSCRRCLQSLDLAAAWWRSNWRSLWPFRPQREVVYKTWTSARLLFMSESQFNYLFTLKNAHLSANCYNFWMQPSIAMKFAGYVAWILLCKSCKFGEQKLLQFQRYRIFHRGLRFGAPCSFWQYKVYAGSAGVL